MINSVVLVGRLTKDPELRFTPSGVPMVRFTLAVNRTFTGQNGEREADFIGCIAWRKQAENLANYMRKGSLIGLEGRIQTGSFEGQDGKRVYTTDVVAGSIQFLEGKKDNAARDNYYSSSEPPASYNGGSQSPSNNHGFGGGTQSPSNNHGFGSGNYTRVNEDPFASSKGPIEVSEDDLPF